MTTPDDETYNEEKHYKCDCGFFHTKGEDCPISDVEDEESDEEEDSDEEKD